MSTYERLVNSQNFFSPYLTQEDVQNLVRKEFPNAVFTKVELDRGDGLYEYEADFYTPEVRGEMKFNPETGTVIEKEIKYTVF